MLELRSVRYECERKNIYWHHKRIILKVCKTERDGKIRTDGEESIRREWKGKERTEIV